MLDALNASDTIDRAKQFLARIRKLFVFVALVLMIIVVTVEAGAPLFAPASTAAHGQARDLSSLQNEAGELLPPEVAQLLAEPNNVTDQLSAPSAELPGWGVRSLAFVDVVTLFSILLIVVSYFAPASWVGKTQGIVTLVFAIILVVAAILYLLLVIVDLLLMVSLLLSIPFGTLIYLFKYAFFDRASAALVITWLFSLKLAFGLCLVATSERYLQNAGLVLAVLSTLVASIIVTFLHTIVPGFLVSITDAIAAIVVCVIAMIWALLLIVGAILSIVNLARSPLNRLT